MTDSTPSRPGSPVGELPAIASAKPYRFNWDGASRRGPGSVSETTEGRGDYFGVSPRVDIYNGASSSAHVLPTEWSSSRHGFHAISTVLNSPHKKQAPPKAHSKLPSAPQADLPRVKRKDFDGYLKVIGPEFQRFEQNLKLGLEGKAQLDASLSERSTNRAIPPLETVPKVFFERPFDLGVSHTFAQVTDQGEDLADQANPATLGHTLPLLDKLEHYADTIEQHLVDEIKSRSTSFFAALTNLQDLQTESEQCLSRIHSLRSLLKDVDEKSAKRGLQIIQLDAKLRNVMKVRKGVNSVKDVVDLTGVARDLVNNGKWEEALDTIEDLEQLWTAPTKAISIASSESTLELTLPRSNRGNTGRGSPLPSMPESPDEDEDLKEPLQRSTKPSVDFPLSSLQAFASLPVHLRTLTLDITTSLSTEIVSALQLDLQHRLSPLRDISADDKTRKALKPLLKNLGRTHFVREATLSWREVALTEIGFLISADIPGLELNELSDKSIVDTDAAEQAIKKLQDQQHVGFLSLLQNVYSSIVRGMEGIQTQNDIIYDIFRTLPPARPSATSKPSSAVDLTLKDDLADILASAAEFSHTQVAKLLTYRAEQHSVLNLRQYLSLFTETWNFVLRSETVCRRMIVGLRGVVLSQAKVFLQSFHQIRISRSAKLVEDEQWNPAEILPALQQITNVIIDSAVQDPSQLIINLESEDDTTISSDIPPPRTNGKENGQIVDPQTPPPSSASNVTAKTNGTGGRKYLKIEDRTYFAVSATTSVLVLILDYLRVVVNMPLLTTDTMAKVIEFLKAFNSRTCQVVLGAGALRSAGLKNITAKHLALASQSLSIMITLIPYIREAFRRHLSTTQAVMLTVFDTLKLDYLEHQNEIHLKLISIMGERLLEHIKSLHQVDWSRNAEKPVNDYMEILVRETMVLNKVLTRYLPVSTVEYVMKEALSNIDRKLTEEYSKITLPNQPAKDRMLADVTHLQTSFSALKNAGTLSGVLLALVKDKSVAGDPPLGRKSSTISLGGNTGASSSPRPSQSTNDRLRGLMSRSTTKVNDVTSSRQNTPPPLPSSGSAGPTGSEVNDGTLSRSNGFKQMVSAESEDTLPATPPAALDGTPPLPPPESEKPILTPTNSRPSTPAPTTPRTSATPLTPNSNAMLDVKLGSPLPALPDLNTQTLNGSDSPLLRSPRSPIPPARNLGLPES